MAMATKRLAWYRAAFLAGLTSVPVFVCAQGLQVRPEVEASLNFTSNAVPAATGLNRSDAIISISPRLNFTSRGGRALLDGTFGIEALAYADNSQESIVRPRGSLRVRTELVEKWLFLNASANADPINADPFAARPEGVTAYNNYTQIRYRMTPYLERQLSPAMTLIGRTDHIITRFVGGSGSSVQARGSQEQEQLLRLEHRPAPFGWATEVKRQESRLQGADNATLAQGAARVTATYSVNPQLSLGATAGHEISKYSLIERSDSITGARLNWRPNERGELSASIEHRYFGAAGEFVWQQRSTFFGFTIRASRAPASQTESRFLGAAGDSVTSLLDGVLTTRYPDPGQRSAVVGDVIRQLNLPATLTGPVELYTSYAQLQEQASATVLFFGRLTTASATIFVRRQDRLIGLEDVLAPVTFDSDNKQIGAEVEATRRLSPVLSLNGGLRYNRIEGLGARQGQATRDASVRFGFTQLVNSATRFSAAIRYQNVSSTATGDSRETAVSAAVLYRF